MREDGDKCLVREVLLIAAASAGALVDPIGINKPIVAIVEPRSAK